MKKALFLDRDGVINVDKHHTYLKEIILSFRKGFLDLCKEYPGSGFLIIVITNQAGIAKGHYYTEAEYNLLTDWMIDQFLKKDIITSKVYYCPSSP